jgi:hypothetical protein
MSNPYEPGSLRRLKEVAALSPPPRRRRLYEPSAIPRPFPPSRRRSPYLPARIPRNKI